jgi:hypothetical protein
MATSPVFAAKDFVQDVVFSGTKRTDKEWLKEYLGITFPIPLEEIRLTDIQEKLETTNIFTFVGIKLSPVNETDNTHVLEVEVIEKWTTIPVIRGASGGGTNLRVFGIYDINTFGRLWTLGGEMRQYNDTAPGGVVWARAPRWKQGSHYLDFELWKNHRTRTLFNRSGNELGSFVENESKFKSVYLSPLGERKFVKSPDWQLGVTLEVKKEPPASFTLNDSNTETPDGIVFHDDTIYSAKTLASIVYDDVTVFQLNMRGLRFLTDFGPVFSRATSYYLTSELFWYFMPVENLNFATHFYAGLTNSKSYGDIFYLGGFDSIRGLVDNRIYGNKAFYSNLEMRYLWLKAEYLWLQSLVFTDIGTADNHVSELDDFFETSFGVGLRLSIPQVYRLILRTDYAWKAKDPRERGFSIGLSQFFEPYKPL